MLPWIKDRGICAEDDLCQLVQGFKPESCLTVAMHTDGFRAAAAGSWKRAINPRTTLLELRIFDENREFWSHRSVLGSNFTWRIADDTALREALKNESDNYYIDTVQTLDIDETYEPYQDGETDDRGCLLLRTTGGGHYALPITKEDGCVLIRNYLQYDENNGAVAAVDYRLTGFEPQKKGV